MERDREVWSVFVYVLGGKRGGWRISSSSYPSPSFGFVLFWPTFFKTCIFLWLVSTGLFLNKTEKRPVAMGRLHCVALTGQLWGMEEGKRIVHEGLRMCEECRRRRSAVIQRLPQGVERGMEGEERRTLQRTEQSNMPWYTSPGNSLDLPPCAPIAYS